ncbi:MAG: preQ(1) synthase [Thermoplasmata archaeon]
MRNIKKLTESSYEGLQDDIKNMVIGTIDVVNFPYQERNTVITVKSEEFTSICPKTGLPDFARISIHYIPDGKLIELKSLKLYLNSYRNVGIFQENAVNKILDDIVKYSDPKFALVIGEFNARGGLTSRIVARYDKKR